MDILQRMLIVIAVAATLVAAWFLIRLWRQWRLRQLQAQSPLADLVPSGKPAVVAFSTPYCLECRTRQAPALQRLQAQWRDRISIVSFSALDHAELVSRLGILTVPATVVLDAAGTVRNLNLGYTSDTQLCEQLAQC
jgi:thiol-disulfide isomerase/thioredoxin